MHLFLNSKVQPVIEIIIYDLTNGIPKDCIVRRN